MKRNRGRGTLLEAILVGLVVALGGAAIILYGPGRQPQNGAARAVATRQATSAPSSTTAPTRGATQPPAPSPDALTPTPAQATASIAPTDEVAVQPDLDQMPREPAGEPPFGLEGMPALLQTAIAQASAHLSQRLGVGLEQIELVGFERLFKPDGAPGGWSVRFMAGGRVYVYTVDQRGNVRPR